MAKQTTEAKLRPWHTEITKAEWEKARLDPTVRNVGFNSKLGKYYRIDMANKDYIKYLEAKKKAKTDRIAGKVKRAFEHGFNKGLKEGVKQYKSSEAMKKRDQIQFNRGIKAAKPKVNQTERLARQEAKLKEKLKAVEQKKAKLAK